MHNMTRQNMIEKSCFKNVVKNLSRKRCFGLSDKEYEELGSILENTVQNEKSNDFPDFTFKNGFVEHFAVTSSKETRQGSKHKSKMFQFEKKSKENFIKGLEEKEHGEILHNRSTMQISGHYEENLINSIKRNWENHEKKIESFKGAKECKIFLMDYQDIGVLQSALLYDDGTEVYESYSLISNKELLKWFTKYQNQIDYIIFHNGFEVEVLKVNKIFDFVDSLPEVITCPLLSWVSDGYAGINLPVSDE